MDAKFSFAYSVAQEWEDRIRLIRYGCSSIVQISSRSIANCNPGAEFYDQQFTLHVVSGVVSTLMSYKLDFFVTYYQRSSLRSSKATAWLFNVFGVIYEHWRAGDLAEWISSR